MIVGIPIADVREEGEESDGEALAVAEKKEKRKGGAESKKRR
jgi:hypothetical protein